MKNEKLLYLVSCIAAKVQNGFVPKRFEPRSILVVKLDEIGDMIYALHVFEHLKTKYHNALLNVYCKSFNNPLLEATGKIDRVINRKEDLEKSYDLIINLRGSWHTFWFAFKCRMRLERGCVRLSNKLHGGQTHEVETNFNITRPILDPGTDMLWPEIKISETDILDVQLLLSDAQIERFAIFHTGARDLNRRWSAAKFAQLAEWLYTEYDVQVVFGGGPGEYADIEAIRKNCKVPTHNFAGRTSLTSFAALCRKSVLFVGNESGPMHIANVMNTPVVALFGPGVKGVFYPYGQNVRVIHHVPESNKDAATSMQKISLEEVQLAISELLNQ